MPEIKSSTLGRLHFHLSWRLVALIFFAALLALGLAIYRDYGIGWDEWPQYTVGRANYQYILGINQSLLTFVDRYYGPIYEIFLYSVTQSLPRYLMHYARHILDYSVFVAGVFGFYLLVRKLWQKQWLALVGCVFLVISPRIFADAFYNSKDIPFMVGLIFATYTLIRYLDDRSWKNLLFHTLATAIVIDIRVTGVFMVALTAGFIFLDWLAIRFQPAKRTVLNLGQLAVFFTAGFSLVVLMWPILWHDPFGEFMNAFRMMSNYPAVVSMLFKGFWFNSDALPLNYIPTWIAITTPLLYLASFGAGLIHSFLVIIRKPLFLITREKRNVLVILAWFFIPILIVVIMRSTLYDGWRQMYFVYPALVLIALYGLNGILKLIRRLPRPESGHMVLAGLILAGLIDPIAFMVRNHPYENVYFNRLAGNNLAEIKNRYDMDYWGLSAKAALDYILRTDPGTNIIIKGDGDPALMNSYLLAPDQAGRIQFTNDINEARYFVTNYRAHPQDYPYPNEVFNVTIDGAKIVSVFQLR